MSPTSLSALESLTDNGRSQRILLACFSRNGHTREIAEAIADECRRRGHQVEMEWLQPLQRPSRWRLALPLLTSVPVLPLYLISSRFRHWWHDHYYQPEQALSPLVHEDLSGFDAIAVGGPKWLYLSYPVARYLDQVKGLEGKSVSGFTCFCGPPLKRFELEMYFGPLHQRLRQRHAQLAGRLALSSHFHEFFIAGEMVWLFRGISRLLFSRPLRSFTLSSEWGQQQLHRFCDELLEQQGR